MFALVLVSALELADVRVDTQSLKTYLKMPWEKAAWDCPNTSNWEHCLSNTFSWQVSAVLSTTSKARSALKKKKKNFLRLRRYLQGKNITKLIYEQLYFSNNCGKPSLERSSNNHYSTNPQMKVNLLGQTPWDWEVSSETHLQHHLWRL